MAEIKATCHECGRGFSVYAEGPISSLNCPFCGVKVVSPQEAAEQPAADDPLDLSYRKE